NHCLAPHGPGSAEGMGAAALGEHAACPCAAPGQPRAAAARPRCVPGGGSFWLPSCSAVSGEDSSPYQYASSQRARPKCPSSGAGCEH
uniref:Uncharacterized protein n=1 Tax=Pavo cristatus TaxID=9049 RepID=A0A8C9FGP1_PAVCR